MQLLEWLSLELKVLFISALPIIELRGAIPFGVSQGMQLGGKWTYSYKLFDWMYIST